VICTNYLRAVLNYLYLQLKFKVAARFYGISWTYPKDFADYQKSTHFSNALNNSSLYSYQLQTWINCSKIRRQWDPLLISTKVL